MNRLVAAGVALLFAGAGIAGTATAANAAPSATKVPKFKNCAAMNKTFKHGVGVPGARDKTASKYKVTTFARSKAIYTANRGLDRDRDGIACEKR